MTQPVIFRHRGAPEDTRLREWHRHLLIQPSRGDRARLRRAGTIEEAALAPAFHALVQRLGIPPGELGPEQMSGIAALAVLAACVDTDTPGRALGKSLGHAAPGSTQAPVSEARFRRLLESETLVDRFDVLRRLVLLLGKKADLHELAAALLDWNANRRRQLAYDYYSGFAGPSDSKEESPS